MAPHAELSAVPVGLPEGRATHLGTGCLMPRHIRTTQLDDITIVEFIDRELVAGPDLEQTSRELYDLVDRDRRIKLVLNFGQVEYLSTTALIKLIHLRHKLGLVGGRLALCEIRPEILEVFQVAHLTKI